VKLNHRRLLDAMLDIAGVVSALGVPLHRTASRALPGPPLCIPCSVEPAFAKARRFLACEGSSGDPHAPVPPLLLCVDRQ
jgi:hypothetical protein